MSNASSAASSSSLAGSQSARNPSPVPTVSGEGRYGENITFPNGLKPNPYQLLHLFNTEQYDDQIRNAANQHNRLEPCVKSLFFLRTQRKLFERIVESCSLEIANQVMYACNYQLGLEGPITVPSTFPFHPHLSMPPPTDPRAMSEYPDPLTFSLIDRLGRRTDGNGYPRPDLNDNRSLISRLTDEPRGNEAGPSTAPSSSSNLDNALVYPDPTPDPDVKYKVEHLKPQFRLRVEHIPMVGGEVVLAESEDAVEDEERENRTPENVEDPPTVSLRSPTPAPTPMMQLVDRVSALCVDWSAIAPDIARSTCVADASRLSLDICLDTALTNEGLAALRVEGLIRAQTLCWMVAVMTMSETTTTNPTTISEGNVEMLVKEYDQDAQLLFVGADSKKVRLLLVEERQAMGWQPPSDPPATPKMEMEDEMLEIDDRLDTSYDYDVELYGDGES
uniref:Reverse transcriptase-rnase h-integrase n=1 Tax=Moniliophthora roreri TaxID=221103 RepID=A0A0W0G2J2_MONRR